MTYPTQIDVCDGKYTVIMDMDSGRAQCLRYGEKWRDLTGDKMVLALFDTIIDLREQLAKHQAAVDVLRQIECAEQVEHYGDAEDLCQIQAGLASSFLEGLK